MIRGSRRVAQGVAVAAAAVAAALGLWFGFDGWPDASTHLRDDAFYEFAFATNIARGNGGMVSDGVSTSGVQPLWCFVLAWLSTGQARAMADLAVVLGVACHLLGALTFAVAGRWRPAGLCAALLWLGNPLLLRESQNGQETALACLCAALLWHGRRRRLRTFAVLAVLAAFARAELLLLVAALAVARLRRDGWRVLLAPAGVFALLLAWCRIAGGGWLPDSGLPMAWLSHANFARTEPTTAEWLRQQWWFTRPVLAGGPYALVSIPGFAALGFLVLRPRWPHGLAWLPVLACGLAAFVGTRDLWIAAGVAGLLWLLRLRPGQPRPAVPLALACLLAALVGIVALHWAVRWYPRDYYLAPLMVGAAAAVLRLRRWPWLLAAVALAAMVRPTLPREPLRHQRAMQVAAVVAPAVLPADERVGCFNAGLLAFARYVQRPPTVAVLGLDGVVDHRAFAALREGRLDAWLDDQGVRFLVDHPAQFELDSRLPHANGPWFGPDFAPAQSLLELVRCVEPGADADRPGTAWVGVYWRRDRGAAPPPPAQPRELSALDDGSAVVLWPAQAGEVLEVEAEDLGRRELLTAEIAICHALAIPRALRGTGRLFVRGAAAPLLTLR